jgi:hypothetical protein
MEFWNTIKIFQCFWKKCEHLYFSFVWTVDELNLINTCSIELLNSSRPRRRAILGYQFEESLVVLKLFQCRPILPSFSSHSPFLRRSHPIHVENHRQLTTSTHPPPVELFLSVQKNIQSFLFLSFLINKNYM